MSRFGVLCAVVSLASASPARAQEPASGVDVVVPDCDPELAWAIELRALLEVEIPGRVAPVRVSAATCTSELVQVEVGSNREEIDLGAVASGAQARTLALIVEALVEAEPGVEAASAEGPDEVESPTVAPSNEARSGPAADAPGSGPPDPWRWSVTSEARWTPVGQAAGGGLRAALGGCSDGELGLCLIGDVGGLLGAAYDTGFVEGDVWLPVIGAGLFAGLEVWLGEVALEVGPRFEFDLAWDPIGLQFREGDTPHAALSGLFTVRYGRGIGFVGQVEVGGWLTPSVLDTPNANGLREVYLALRLGVAG